MTNRASVEQLKTKLQGDLAQVQNHALQIQGAILACDKLIANDDAEEQAEAKVAKKKTK